MEKGIESKVKKEFKERKWDVGALKLVKGIISSLKKEDPMKWDEFYKRTYLDHVLDTQTQEDIKLLAALEQPYLLPYLYGVKTFEKAGYGYITRMGKTAYISTRGFTCYGCSVFDEPEFHHLISKGGKPESRLEKLLKGADVLVLTHHDAGEEGCGTKYMAEAIAKKYGIKEVHCSYFDSEYHTKDYYQMQEKEQKKQKIKK